MKKMSGAWKLFFLLSLSLSAIYAQEKDSGIPRSYTAFKTLQPIHVDGVAEEEAWEKVSWTDDFIDIEGDKTPLYRTRMKMLWDEDYLYFYAELEEPHVWATLKERDTVIFYNNDFEIFIDPDGDTHNYYEFEMNALNTVWDLFLVKPYREPAPIVDSWDIHGLKSAVHINGTLNNPVDKDTGWTVEIAMPWSVLKEANSHGDLPANEFWRINFSRVNWDFDLHENRYSRKKDANGKFLPEYNWVWSPQGVINMHEPERWGYVYFSTDVPGSPSTFSLPPDEPIKWKLYELYRAQKKYFHAHKKWAENLSELRMESFMVNKAELNPKLELHQTGWNISVVSPFTGKTLTLIQDGKLIVN